MNKVTRRVPGDLGTITIEEARRRWRAHQARIQHNLGRPGLALRLVPPGSAQYRAAKRLLGRALSASPAVSWTARLSHSWAPPQPPFLPNDVLWRAIGESPDLIDQTNAAVATTTEHTWIFPVLPLDMEGGPNGIFELTKAAPDVDVLYCDETAPGFENLTPLAPGRHTLIGYNQLGRSVLIRRDAWLRAGGLDRTMGEAAIADLLLRLVESDASFFRVDTVLAWPQPPGPLDQRASEQAIHRRGVATKNNFVSPRVLDWRVTLPAPQPTVDILVPTRDRLDLLRQCIDSISSHTDYENYRVVVLDNDSTEAETLAYLETMTVTKCPGPFNYASIINRGVAASTADFVVTLNNDVIVTDPTWLATLVGYAMLPDVGIAGPRLLNAAGVSDHDGITIAPYPQHLQRDVNYGWDDDFVHSIRNVAAVTGACQVFERRKWNEVGGMDESLAVTFNDIDVCLRLSTAGYETLFTPNVELIHIGKASRGSAEALDDHFRFIQYWDICGSFDDRYVPARLELVGPRYSIRR